MPRSISGEKQPAIAGIGFLKSPSSIYINLQRVSTSRKPGVSLQAEFGDIRVADRYYVVEPSGKMAMIHEVLLDSKV